MRSRTRHPGRVLTQGPAQHTAVSTWWPETLAGITTGITNAASEGINRLIKTDARCAFGYRNPANQRLRARCATTRRARGHLTTRTSGRHAQPRQGMIGL